MLRSAPRKAALLALGATALAAPAAHADSIVFIEGGNVHVSQPDGSGKVRLTDGGNWHSPAQAADGRIAATRGRIPEIVIMARDGRQLGTIATPPAPMGNGGTFEGVPTDIAWSPDGSKIAYAYNGASCPPGSSCSTSQRSTFYTRSDVATATPHSVHGNQFGVGDPEWITDDRALTFGGYGSHANIDDINGSGPDGSDYSFDNWFNDEEDVSDGELSPDGKRLVYLRSYAENLHLAFGVVNGDPRTAPLDHSNSSGSAKPLPEPTMSCITTGTDALYGDPSWAPDSQSVAFQSSAGIETFTFTRLDAEGCAGTGPSKVVVPGGSQPDWGPAEPPAARYAPSTPQPQPKPQPQPQPQPQPGTLELTAVAATSQRFAGKLAVTCSTPVAATCSAIAMVKVGRRTYKASKVSRTVAAGGKATLTLRFGAKARTAIRKALRRKPLVATVTVTAETSAGSVAVSRRTIKLKR